MLPAFSPLDLPLLFLAVASSVVVVVSGRDVSLRRLGEFLPVLAFVLARLLSAVVADDRSAALHVLLPLFPALLLFLLLSEWIVTEVQIVAIYLCLSVVGLGLSAMVLVAALGNAGADPDTWAAGRLSALLVVKNDLAVGAILVPFALASVRRAPWPLGWLVTGGLCAALIAAIAVVRSRTALVTLVTSLVAFTVLSSPTRPALRNRIAVIVLLIVAWISIDVWRGAGVGDKLAQERQGRGRLALWAAAGDMFVTAPLLGHGPNSFVSHYRSHLSSLDLPRWIAVDARISPWAHNLYLELLAEQGLLGFACFVALAGRYLATVRRISTGPSPHRILGAAAGAALASFLMAAFFELSFIRAWVTILLFTLFGILTSVTRLGEEKACESS